MMKRMLVGTLAVALALIGTGCNSSSNNTTLERPTVTPLAVNDGGTLRLSWEAVTGATGYEITAGDSVYTTTSTSFDVTTPVTTIKVRSVKGSTKSDSATTINCGIVEDTVEFYGDLDTTHADGFGFADDGSASGYKLYYTYLGDIDFYAQISQGAMTLISAGGVNATRRGNAMKEASVGYDAIGIADSLGAYVTSLPIKADSSYYLRISGDTSATWDANDHFAKANVVLIDSAKITLKVGYQKVAGIRWLIK